MIKAYKKTNIVLYFDVKATLKMLEAPESYIPSEVHFCTFKIKSCSLSLVSGTMLDGQKKYLYFMCWRSIRIMLSSPP